MLFRSVSSSVDDKERVLDLGHAFESEGLEVGANLVEKAVNRLKRGSRARPALYERVVCSGTSYSFSRCVSPSPSALEARRRTERVADRDREMLRDVLVIEAPVREAVTRVLTPRISKKVQSRNADAHAGPQATSCSSAARLPFCFSSLATRDREARTHPSSLSESPNTTSCSKWGLKEASKSREVASKTRGAEKAEGRTTVAAKRAAQQQRTIPAKD